MAVKKAAKKVKTDPREDFFKGLVQRQKKVLSGGN